MTFSSYEMEDAIVEDEAFLVEGSDERSNPSGVFFKPSPHFGATKTSYITTEVVSSCVVCLFFWGGKGLV